MFIRIISNNFVDIYISNLTWIFFVILNTDIGIFGYKTWWLSSDVTTQRAAYSVDKDKYMVSCCMRPDFLYNYISFAPSKGQVDHLFKHYLPSLIGVNLSSNFPPEITTIIQKYIQEQRGKNPARLKSTIREIIDDLKSDPSYQTKEHVKRFFSTHWNPYVDKNI